MSKKRVTLHNGRANKNGVYSAKHNDRNFDVTKHKHIDATKVADNLIVKCMPEYDSEGMSFDDYELAVYNGLFSKSLEKRNAKQRKNHHYNAVQTMDEYRRNKKGAPEESIIQVGNAENTVTHELLASVYDAYFDWHSEVYPQVIVLDVALHLDEPDTAPHIHERKVWTATDEEGNLYVSQIDCLAQMGVERPDKSKPRNRYNNPKITYTEACRKKFFEICKEHGIEIEEKPREASKSGLAHEEYKRRQEEKKRREAERKCKEAEKKLDDLQRVQEQQEQEIKKLKEERAEAQAENKRLQAENEALRKQVQQTKSEQKQVERAKAQTEQELQGKRQELQSTIESVDVITQAVTDNIKPKKRLFFKRADRYVMSKSEYESVQHSVDELRSSTRRIANRNNATEEELRKAEQERAEAERLRKQRQDEITKQAEELSRPARLQAIKARREYEQLKANEEEIINKQVVERIESLTKGSQTLSERAIGFLKGITLADGKNALERFTESFKSIDYRKRVNNSYSYDDTPEDTHNFNFDL